MNLMKNAVQLHGEGAPVNAHFDSDEVVYSYRSEVRAVYRNWGNQERVDSLFCSPVVYIEVITTDLVAAPGKIAS